MSLDEAIKVLRQHNEKGASVLRITRGQALEKDLLTQVLDSCEQLISEKAEYKRLLKAAVEDMKDVVSSDSGCRCCKGEQAASCAYIKCWTWRYADEVFALIGEEGKENGRN